ncbi:MAG: hypothetical protein M3Z06_09065 [Actinomycetota bacterium]|nr:hypothetical protein [Actinomycetota bacterium]
MNVPTRLAGFAAVLGLAFGGAALAGATFDPPSKASGARLGHDPMATMGQSGHSAPVAHGAVGATSGMSGMDGAEASGLAVSSGGLTLEATRTYFTAGRPAKLQFRITDARGRALRNEFQVESARRLHFIVVRRDTTIYQHLHPTEAKDGTWSVALTLPQAGVYRAYADFQIAGQKHVLATDLFVPGAFVPNALPAPSDTGQARLDETRQLSGERVSLQAPGLKAGVETLLTFTVNRGGRPVSDLQPYLGAKGHLVALREGDLAYLHVHPDPGQVAANAIQFRSSFPTAGTYRLFLQFQRDAKVRTVVYTLEVPR